MRTAAVILLCLTLAAFASVRTGGGDVRNPISTDGTYTVVNIFAGGLASTYGLAIQDDVTNSIWLSNWGDVTNYEYSMATGSATGTTWAITDGIDPDDQGYCEYTAGNQFFFGDWTYSNIGVYSDAGTYLKNIVGPVSWDTVTGVCAGGDMLYCSDFHVDEVAWGTYTGSESTVTWTTATFENVAGMAIYGEYIFMTCQMDLGVDNTFIFHVNPDGSINMTPVWSCEFMEEDMTSAGSIEWDGTYLWLYPQNTFLYQVDIDWVPGALDQSTWGGIKAEF